LSRPKPTRVAVPIEEEEYVTFTKCREAHCIKEDEMGESCKTHGLDKINLIKYYLKNLNYRELFPDLILNENILRRLILI